ncbi:MAG: hypothetical protein GY820_18015, partial [Gammaproteobacteria bacterium]|nr:hypothetical protein [Gammaproteobacteria bacterium]
MTAPSKTREFFGHNYLVRGKARGSAQGHRIVEQTYTDPYYEEDPPGEFPHNRETGPPPAPQQPFPWYGQGRPDPAREYRKIPTVLCPRFGERYNTKDFNTFEREFSQLCILCEVPADQKLTRFMLHLEGPIQNHAQCWLDSRKGQVPEYRALIEELRRSFQRTIDVEEAESNLHGRKWNPYEMTIDEFLHDTRLLVQQAYPGEHGRWDAKIRACLCRALPVELEQIVASNTRAINDLIEWVRTHTRTIVQGTAPDEDAEGWVHKVYEKYQIKKKPVPKGSMKGEENPKEKVETQIIPRVNNRFGNNA